LIKDLHPAVQVSPLLTASPELQSQASAARSRRGESAAISGLRHSSDPRVRCYSSQFADLMEMRAPAAVVGAYLDRHEGWFRRCAAPMQVTPLSRNGYALTLGRFGNFGFEVEPTIGLELLPQCKGVYRILTVPGAASHLGTLDEQLYDVEFNAALELEQEAQGQPESESAFTEVRWQLDLSVWIRLPGVITLLPEGLVQSSGEHLLRQIVRQISRRLTWKVQEDFHASHGLECPPRRRAQF
jgi:hypothetical protein